MDPNPVVRSYNGEYYLYTPTKTVDAEGFSYGTGGTVRKLTAEENPRGTYNQNNTFRATIDPETWVKNAQWTQEDFKTGIQNAFKGFDPNNTTGWQNQMDSLIQQASSIYNTDPNRGTKVFGDVWNTFRNNNLPAIEKLQAENNPSRPEFTSQSQAQTYAQTGQMTNQQQRDQMARNGSQQSVQPAYTGPTTTRLNMQTGLLEKVPASSVVADQLPMTVSKTITPDQLTNTTNTSGLFPTIANGSVGTQTALNVGEIGLSALDRALLQFNVRQQESAAEQRTQAETALAQAQQGLANVYNTNRESEITRIMQEAGIKEKQAALSDLKVKMAQAQEALNLGLQQENGRIAPMSIIGRRQSLLVEQAQGKIGALAAIANVYADDLDQAWNVANLTIDAMNQDRQEKIDAYKFLITANENKIVNLKAEEKTAINSQIKILQDAQTKVEANKDKIMQLMFDHTIEFQNAKISLTDTYEQAAAKIQPELAKTATQKLALENAQKQAELAKTQAETNKIRGGSGSGGGGGAGGGGNVSALTQSIIENPSLFDDLTPTNRGRVIAELQKNGYDTSNLGVKGLSDTAISSIAQTKKAIEDLAGLKTIIQGNEKYVGPITGLQRFNPWSKAKKVQSDVDRVRQTVGKALEGGVLRKEDEEKYKKILATLADTPETAIYKIDALASSIQRDIETYKSLQLTSGRSANVGAALQKKGTSQSAPEDLRNKYNY
jgi:hypothetical protein